jgi:hypothetical protein
VVSVIRKLATTERVSRSTLALSAVAVPVALSPYCSRGLENMPMRVDPVQPYAMIDLKKPIEGAVVKPSSQYL